MNKYGFKKDEILPEHYKFGAGQLQSDILQPNGQWDQFLPPDEFQNLYGVEPYACATFGTLNGAETLAHRLYGRVENFSDRFLAAISGTAAARSNSPHTVAEFLRKTGVVHESDWPVTPDIDTFEKYYGPIPDDVTELARQFVDFFDFGHDWVNTDPASLKNALQYSPIGISMFAWVQGSDGLYYKPAGEADNHFVLLYGYEEGKFWKIFDSYDQTHKRITWDTKFEQAKRYTLKVRTERLPELSRLQRILQILSQILHLDALMATIQPEPPAAPPTPPIEPVTPPAAPEPVIAPPVPVQSSEALLTAFCEAIKSYEGWIAPCAQWPTGTPAYRNKNPGNLRYAGQPGAIGKDKSGFAIFPTEAAGMAALKAQIRSVARGMSATYNKRALDWYDHQSGAQLNLYEYFSIYSPSTDGNNPKRYAEVVAERIGVSPQTFLISNFA